MAKQHSIRTLVTALALAAAAAGAAVAAGLPPFAAATTKVATGTWDGIGWTLYAGESSTATAFSHCIKVVLRPSPRYFGGGGCSGGGLFKPGELLPTSPPAPRFGYGITFAVSTACPTFAVLDGLVLADARQVTITLSDGRRFTTPTIPSPPRLAQSLRFWATHIPCGTTLSAITGFAAGGRIVARADSLFLPHIR